MDLSRFLALKRFTKSLYKSGRTLSVFFVSLVIVLGGCTGQDRESPSPTPPETAEATAAPTEIPPTETAVPTQLPDAVTPTTPAGTAEPSPTSPPIPTSTPTPLPVNGLDVDEFVVLPDDVIEHMQEVFALGQEMGRNPTAYSVLGDSTSMNPHILARFDQDDLNLGPYDYLQPAVDQFAGSFSQYGVAARNGLHSWSIFDPIWADKKWCLPNENLLACEFRLRDPVILLIRLGSNDSGSPDGFRYNVRKAIEYSLEQGVMPIIATKADRFEGDSNENNIILRELAETYKVPLWDFDKVAATLPDRGLEEDHIHMVEYLPNDYTQESAFESGHALQDLTGLMMFYALWQDVIYPASGPVSEQSRAVPTEAPILVNGVPVDSFVILPESVKRAMSVVFYEGQAVGRIPNHFSKIGDSLIATPNAMTLFDSGPYDLGDYAYLQPVIDYFNGSFARYGVGTKAGMRSWSAFNHGWADPKWCGPEEGPLACEIRLHNPSIALVFLGSNDINTAENYDENMRRLVVYATTNGVIPVLVTKADRFEGAGNRNNDLLRQIAADYQVPLVDFDVVAATLPNRGLSEDDIHLTSVGVDDFIMPQALESGYGTQNIVVLLGLYAVWQEIVVPALVVDAGQPVNGNVTS
ncbi:MAG: SGNH/GDSL hydrolase family protein [Candidatus Promineifilaceae bacterium]